jgi:hypothetical protein
MTSRSSSGALEAVERILNRGGDADAVLLQVVEALQQRAAAWAGIAFVEHGRLELGPSAGGPVPEDHRRHVVRWQGTPVAELWTSADADPALCARVALIVSPYCAKS